MKKLALVLFLSALVTNLALAQEICVDSSTGNATKLQCTDGIADFDPQFNTVTVETTPTVDGGNAYATGDCIIAAAAEIAGAARSGISTGYIKSVTMGDLSANAINVDVVFFDSAVGNVCSAINAAFDIDDADLDDVVGVVHLTEHNSWNDSSTSQAVDINIPFDLGSGTSLYYALVARGAPTYAASDLKMRFTIAQD